MNTTVGAGPYVEPGERTGDARPGRTYLPDPRRRHAGARRPGGGPGRGLRTRRLVGRLLGRAAGPGDGRVDVTALRPRPRPQDLRDLRGLLAARRRTRRGPAEQRDQARRLHDAR